MPKRLLFSPQKKKKKVPRDERERRSGRGARPGDARPEGSSGTASGCQGVPSSNLLVKTRWPLQRELPLERC